MLVSCHGGLAARFCRDRAFTGRTLLDGRQYSCSYYDSWGWLRSRYTGHRNSPRQILVPRASAEPQRSGLDALRKQLADQVREERARDGLEAGDKQCRATSDGSAWGPDNTGSDESLRWARYLTELREYRKENGSCDVPVGCPGYRELGAWVHEQRHAIQRGQLHPRRRKLLQDLGLDDYGAKEAAWAAAATKLEVYARTHGHSNVPLENPELGIWVYRQRQFKGAGLLEPEKVQRLDRIGFMW